MSDAFQLRRAVRALIIAEPEERVLLIHTYIPDTDTLIWLAPGGGVEADEDMHAALFREISEETGFTVDACEGPVWHRRQKFYLHGNAYDQQEEFYVVRTTMFEPDNTANPAEDERDIFRGFKWWSLEEIARATAAREEIFVPLTFAQHFERLLRDGLPVAAYDVGR